MTAAGAAENLDRRQALARATEEALTLRGTVMLDVPGDERRWCAVCASVQGHVELRVGEPSRGWRRWRPAPGERWLADNGFVQVIDAWACPVRFGAGPAECAHLLDRAVEHGLDTDAGAPAGPHAGPARRGRTRHRAAARRAVRGSPRRRLRSAGRRRARKAHIENGRPARLWAWAFVAEDALLVEPKSPDGTEAWRFPLSPESPVEAARRLVARLHADPEEPLLVSLIDAGDGDRVTPPG